MRNIILAENQYFFSVCMRDIANYRLHLYFCHEAKVILKPAAHFVRKCATTSALFNLPVFAIYEMVVNKSHRLHKGINGNCA